SRTVPFVSKAIGVPLAKIAARCMVGRTLAAQGFTREVVPAHTSVKEAVFPFIKFPGVDTVLGPEMKSTGEVMGIDGSFGAAFAKAQVAAAVNTPAGADSQRDAYQIRRTALECRVPYFTTLAAAAAAAEGIELMRRGPFGVRPLQDHHRPI